MLQRLLFAAVWASTVGRFCCCDCSAIDVSPGDRQAAEKILAQWYAVTSAAKSVYCESDAKIEAVAKGQKPISEISAYRMVFERPNRLAFSASRGQVMSVVIDSKQRYEYLAAKKKYHLKAKASATPADWDSARVLGYANYGLGIGPVGDVLRLPTFADFFSSCTSAEYLGLEMKGGPPAHHLRWTQQGTPIDVWFADADGKLLRIAVADMRPLLKRLAEQEAAAAAQAGKTPEPPKEPFPPEVTVSMTISYKNWKIDTPVPAVMFKVIPPPGAEAVYDIFTTFSHPMLGKQAPAFATTTLQGAPLTAADLAGKVVVLDFWATWCGPCVDALPKITDATAKYRGKGVVFLAVNQDESPADIHAFLTAKNLTSPVVLDPGGRIGSLYAVGGIPQTVVIDQQGRIQVVHVGAGSDIGEQLSRELDDVLAGKDLVAQKVEQ